MGAQYEINGKEFTLVDELPPYLTMKMVKAANTLETTQNPEEAMSSASVLLDYLLAIVVKEQRDDLDRHLTMNDFESMQKMNECIGGAMQVLTGRPKDSSTPIISAGSSEKLEPRYQVVSLSGGINLPQAQQAG